MAARRPPARHMRYRRFLRREHRGGDVSRRASRSTLRGPMATALPPMPRDRRAVDKRVRAGPNGRRRTLTDATRGCRRGLVRSAESRRTHSPPGVVDHSPASSPAAARGEDGRRRRPFCALRPRKTATAIANGRPPTSPVALPPAGPVTTATPFPRRPSPRVRAAIPTPCVNPEVLPELAFRQQVLPRRSA